MLKVLTRCTSRNSFAPRLHGYVPASIEPASPLLRVLRGQNYVFRSFFCSDSTDGSDSSELAGTDAKRVEAGDEAADSKSSSAIVPIVVRPEDCLTHQTYSAFGYAFLGRRRLSLYFDEYWRAPFGFSFARFFSSQAAVEASTSEGLTVEGIIANNWVIYDENESDWKSHASAVAQSIHLIKKRLRWKRLISRLEILSEQLNEPDLWDDPARAGKISREHGSILGKIKEVNTLEQELFEHIDMIKLAREENDSELQSESLKALLTLRRHIKEKELEALLAGEHDSSSCFIEVQAGAGGTESMDWASMVMQMYKKWAEARGFGVTVVDEMPGDIAGIKRATIKVDGEHAFGYAKAEVGAHRLVRISPFDSNKRRHTSFASVAVIPILGDGFSHVQINESDLRIERFRAGGPGGQHANTTESAVRITHIPTGISASCQNERSQHQNKAFAMAVLQSRLDQLEMERQAQINAEHTVSLTDINFGSQIRSYVLHPYRMVKDHRTNFEVSDPDSVLQGDLDGFILRFLSAALDKVEHDNS